MLLAEIDGWQAFFNVLNFVIPALIVFGVVYYIIDKFMIEQRAIRLLELKKEQIKELTPIKLQAYERLTLFLDRISLDNIVIRLSRADQTATQLRNELIQTISGEFNHNISQQIYVSNDAWNMIKGVKEQIMAIVDVCYKECGLNDSGPDLGKKILNRLINEQNKPTQRAIELLKKEIEIVL